MASFAICIVVIVGFALWLTYSRIGKATRAISDNPPLAAASGIDVDAVVRIVWIVAGALAGLAGILYAYFRPGLKWDMGAQMLLLIFAAVTLGGLGTAFGALVGSIVVGLAGRGLHAVDPVRPQVRGSAGRADRDPAVPTAGHPRPSRENRLGAPMDWLQILNNSASSILSPGDDRLRARGDSASPCTSATPACSTSVWRASWPSAPTATRSRSSRFGFPWWVGVLVGMAAAAVFALDPRHPDPAAARRLSRHRDDRGGRDRASAVPDDDVRRGHRLGRRPQRVPRELPRRRTRSPRARTASARSTYNDVGLVGAHLRPRRRSRSRRSTVWRLMRSPWGRVLKGIREDEDAVRSLGKNVFAYKMQALVVGGVIGAVGGIVYALPSAVSPGVLRDVADVLRLDGPAARRRGDGLRPAARLADLLGAA